ncbi:MAG: hypothetical protein RR721_14805 [Aeromonas sp.]|uniref:hypothetical protein n=1 Tax=Aeromonas sp. TaxID=647 RepID=UPI002FCBA54D
MKSWIKVGLAGCLVLVAGLWGGSVRAAGFECLQPHGPGYGMEHNPDLRVDSSLGMRLASQDSAPESDDALAP